jgi:hypothetical protein
MRLEQAANSIGVSKEAIVLSKRFARFIHRSKYKKRTYFDTEDYLIYEGLVGQLIAKTGLFVEYLKHERGFTSKRICNETGANADTISKLDFSEKMAYKVAQWYQKNAPELIEEFDTYYGWVKCK